MERIVSPLATDTVGYIAPKKLTQSLQESSQPTVVTRVHTSPPNPAKLSGEQIRGLVLIVDDQPDIRKLCRIALSTDGLVCDEVGSGPEAILAASRKPYDLIILDVDLPGLCGNQVLTQLRLCPCSHHLKVVMFSGTADGDELSRILLAGADDFLTKPFTTTQLRARVKSALRLKTAQDRADRLNSELLSLNAELEGTLVARNGELIHARNGLVLALAKLIEHRSAETGTHLMRLQKYCQIITTEAAKLPAFSQLLDSNFCRTLQDCAPLHDIGKAALPDEVLSKPGPLTEHERAIMQTHTTIGAETLGVVAREHPFALGFLHMAIDIARHHHERWDGTGYPDQLSGCDIPLAARILAIADVYDALRAERVYKPAHSHESAVRIILKQSTGHFDPALLEVFRLAEQQFETAFDEFIC